jgi:hypothetical protein
VLDKMNNWVLAHPQVLVSLAALGVGIAINNYVNVVQAAKNIEDLRASEMLGG